MIDINQCVRYCTEYSDGREWGGGEERGHSAQILSGLEYVLHCSG